MNTLCYSSDFNKSPFFVQKVLEKIKLSYFDKFEDQKGNTFLTSRGPPIARKWVPMNQSLPISHQMDLRLGYFVILSQIW